MLYAQMNESRLLIDLSGIWKLKLGSDVFEEKYMTEPLEEYENIAVPASYNDQKDSIDYRDHYGFAYYQKSFSLPKTVASERVVLRFSAVTHKARVYLNGTEIARHEGGFLPFEAEIKNLSSGENLLCVSTDNRIDFSTLPVGNEMSQSMFGSSAPMFESVRQTKVKAQNYPNFDFFNYAGIHRPVKIYTTPKQAYIKDISINTDIDGMDGLVHYSICACGESKVRVQVLDKQQRVVCCAEGEKGCIRIENATLWYPGKAYLYTLKVCFGDDCYYQKFGIRTVKVEKDKFLINAQPFYFKGFGKHEDSEIHGRGLDEVLNVKDLSLMKWIGANSFRTSHYPYSEEMLNLCDEEGIVVIGEAPAVGLNFPNRKEDWYKDLSRTYSHHESVIKDMIARDKNHPCIVMWSIANEPDTSERAESAFEYFKPLYELAHKSDVQNRPVTVVVCNNDYVKDITAPYMDVICLNRYYGWYIFGGDLRSAESAMNVEMEYWKKFNKPVMITEYGADAVAGLHSSVPGMFSEEYQTEYYKTINRVLDKYSFVVGEQPWNFADFATIQGVMRVAGNKKGIFTRDRKPKLAAHYFRNRWTAIPDFGYKK